VNILAARRFLTLTPFDLTSEQGRSDERYRLALLSMAANVLSRGVAVIVMVLSVSLTLPYLGAERFGVWMTIASFAGMLSFLDLGIGNALANKVAQTAALSDQEALSALISGGLGFLMLVGLSLAVLLSGLVFVLPWEMLVKVQDKTLYGEMRQAVLLFAILFGFQIVSNAVHRIFAGLQRAFEGHIANALASVVSLICLLVVTKQQAGILPLLLVTFGIQIFLSLLLLPLLSKRRLFTFSSFVKNVRKETPDLMSAGGLFLLLQIGVMLSAGVDGLIVSSQLGVAQVAIFSLVQRLFQLSTQPMYIMNAPLWGAYSDADARGDKNFIRKTLSLSLRNTSIFAAFSALCLMYFGSDIIQMWTKNTVHIPQVLLIAYGIWSILEMVGNALGIFLNGCGVVKQQVVTVTLFSFVSILAKLYGIQAYGLEGMVAGLILSYAVITGFMYGFIYREELERKIN